MPTTAQIKHAKACLEESRRMQERIKQAREVVNRVSAMQNHRAPLEDTGLSWHDYFEAEHDTRRSVTQISPTLSQQASEKVYEAQYSLLPSFQCEGINFNPVKLGYGEAQRALRPVYYDHAPERVMAIHIKRKAIHRRFHGPHMALVSSDDTLEKLLEHAQERFNRPWQGFWIVWPTRKIMPTGIHVKHAAVLKVYYEHHHAKPELFIATPDYERSSMNPHHRFFHPATLEDAWQWLAHYNLERDNWLDHQPLPEYVPPYWAAEATPYLFWQERPSDKKKYGAQLHLKKLVSEMVERAYRTGLFPYSKDESAYFRDPEENQD